jgi:membrane protein DedA with SNARE-associated domain
LPGISLLSVAMAGITRMPLPLFLLLDGLGALLFVGIAITFDCLFHNEINGALSKLAGLGLLGLAAAVGAVGVYLAVKLLQRHLFIRSLRMNRVTVDELFGVSWMRAKIF